MRTRSAFFLFSLYSLWFLQPMVRSAAADEEGDKVLAAVGTWHVQSDWNEMRTVLVNKTQNFTCVHSGPVNN